MNIEQITQLTNDHTLRWSAGKERPVIYVANAVMSDHRELVIEYSMFIDLSQGSGATAAYSLKGYLSGVPIFFIPVDKSFGDVITAAALDYVEGCILTP